MNATGTHNSSSPPTLPILISAAVLGIAGDALLRAAPWCVNLALWTLALTCAVPLISILGRAGPRDGTDWQVGLLAFFALTLVWRDSPMLKALAILGVLAALAATSLRVPSARLRGVTLLDAGLGASAAAIHTLFGAVPLLRHERAWLQKHPEHGSPQMLSAARGVLLGVPLVLIFGSLFASADAAFAGLAGRLIRIDVGDTAGHVIVAGLLAWLVAGFLRGSLFGRGIAIAGGGTRESLALIDDSTAGPGTNLDTLAQSITGELRQALAVGSIEIGIVLGLLDLLFLCFVVVQFRYLFGGASLVDASSTLTYAEYARRGFFELVAAATLVLPLLLLMDWLRRENVSRPAAVFRAGAAALLVLVAIVVVSAVQRMRVYEAEYGMTELRLYTTAFMAWVAFVLVWFASTVLPGKRARFAFGAGVAAVILCLGLNMLNPSALIVRLNAGRVRAGHPFDAAYATSLGADAAPELLSVITDLSRDDQCQLARALLDTWRTDRGDWRTWDISRTEAVRAVQARAGDLRAFHCDDQ